METMLETARRYVAAGLSVIPIMQRSKVPYYVPISLTSGRMENWEPSDARANWRVYCDRMPTDHELKVWFDDGLAEIGIVGGGISGGLVRIDFEHRDCIHTWYDVLGLDSYPALKLAAMTLPVVETGKGHHIYMRMPDPPGHVVLCVGGGGSEAIVFAETQGEGCYCVAPPSKGYRADFSEFQYRWIDGGPEAIPTFDQELATTLLNAARFPGLWDPAFTASWGNRSGILHRSGLTLQAPNEPDLWLGWEHLRALRSYFHRYGSLLHAVETAPPPPPSYDIYDDGEGYDED